MKHIKQSIKNIKLGERHIKIGKVNINNVIWLLDRILHGIFNVMT